MGSVNGGGVGGSLPIAIGAALAHRKHGRLCVRFQADGDMLYVNSALWTATHHRIPMLIVMHNNRAYHQEVMHLQRMANRRQRGMDVAHGGLPGSTITRSEHRLREDGPQHGRLCGGADFEPEGLAAGASARRGAGRKGRGSPARHHSPNRDSMPGEKRQRCHATGRTAHRRDGTAGGRNVGPREQASAAPAGNAAKGKTLFVERACWQCHGLAAQGGGVAGPRLAGRFPRGRRSRATCGDRPKR